MNHCCINYHNASVVQWGNETTRDQEESESEVFIDLYNIHNIMYRTNYEITVFMPQKTKDKARSLPLAPSPVVVPQTSSHTSPPCHVSQPAELSPQQKHHFIEISLEVLFCFGFVWLKIGSSIVNI